jgi:hypothetical protein
MLTVTLTDTENAMPDLTFDFKWYKHVRGYRLVPAKLHRGSVLGAQPDDIEPAKIVPEGGPLQSYRPFAKSENLFELFVRRAKSEEGVLEFVKNFGPLTHDGLRKGGEVVQDIIDAAEEMSGVLRGHIIATTLSPLKVSIITDDERRLRLKISPQCLLDALWLQLAQVSGSASFRECWNCSEPFVAGVKGNRRGDAKFCSDKCRIEFNSLQRSRKDR